MIKKISLICKKIPFNHFKPNIPSIANILKVNHVNYSINHKNNNNVCSNHILKSEKDDKNNKKD